MTLTEAQVERWRQLMLNDYMADCSIADPVNREQINALCDLALAQIRAQGQAVAITNSMAFSFHRALTDGAMSESDLEDIKSGLRAALANAAAPQPAQGMVTLPEVVLNSAISMLEVDGDEHNVAAFLRANIAAAQKGEANCASETRPEVTRPETPAPAAPTHDPRNEPALNGPYAKSGELAQELGMPPGQAKQFETRLEYLAGARPTAVPQGKLSAVVPAVSTAPVGTAPTHDALADEIERELEYTSYAEVALSFHDNQWRRIKWRRIISALRQSGAGSKDVELLELLRPVEIWLRGALDCKDFRWDSDQYEAADESCKRLSEFVTTLKERT